MSDRFSVAALLAVATLAMAVTPCRADPLPFRNSDRGGLGCPSGYVSSGSYCRPSSSDARDAVPRGKGDTCPSGWVSSGNACVRSK